MSQDTTWSAKEFFGSFLFAIFLGGLGTYMFMNPSGGEEMTTEGRRGLWKLLIKYIWSDVGGIVLIVVGVLLLAMTIHQLVKQARG